MIAKEKENQNTSIKIEPNKIHKRKNKIGKRVEEVIKGDSHRQRSEK